MSKPIVEPSTPRKVETQRWGSDQLFRRPLRPGSRECMVGYETTLTTVTNTVTPVTFLSFTVPANDVQLGNIVYIQWTWSGDNHTSGAVQPTITIVWGTSGFTFTLDAGELSTWGATPPYGGFLGMWALLLQREGDTADPTDPDGSFFVMNPAGFHPTEAPSIDPALLGTSNPIVWDDVDFTIDQLVEVQISWDVADTHIRMQPHTASATRWC